MTERRSFIKKFAAGALTASMLPISKDAAATEVRLTNKLIHHVFFWLKNPEKEADKQQLIKALNKLTNIETVKMSHIGFPASTEKRDVVDHSYSASLLLIFDDQAGQDAYQIHPIHLKFVEENAHLWEKVVVYDTAD